MRTLSGVLSLPPRVVREGAARLSQLWPRSGRRSPWPSSNEARRPQPSAEPAERPALERHPEDGWVFADPFPMLPATERAFAALIAALCPTTPAPDSAEIHASVADTARRSMRYVPPLVAGVMTLAIHILDASPLWTRQRMRRLQDLTREEASEALTALDATPLGQMLLLLARMMVLSAYFDLDEVQAAIGYEPHAFMRERAALRARLLAGEGFTTADMIGPFSSKVTP